MVNPGKKKRTMATKRKKKTTRRPPKGFRTWKAYMASIRPGTAKRKTSSRRKRATVRENPGMATKTRKRRKASTSRKAAPRRRRRYRRNPGNDIVGTLTTGAKNAAFVVGGKMAARAVPSALGLPTAGIAGMGVQAAVGVAIAMFGEKTLPRGAADFVLAGALTGPIESAIKAAGIPYVSGLLAGYMDAPLLTGGRNLSALAGSYEDARVPAAYSYTN
jgi:hypothetical protein